MGEKTCCFYLGEKQVNTENLKSKLKKEIKKLVINFNVTKFFVRAESDFNSLCTECIKEIKNEYSHLRLCLVLTDFTSKVRLNKLFDEIIYVNLGEMSSQLLNLSLFDWLISKSDFLISMKNENQPRITVKNLANKDLLFFSTRIKLLRLKQGMSQAELAESIGVAVSIVGMYEQGRREPDFPTFLSMCIKLNTTPDYVLGLEKRFKPKLFEIEALLSEFTEEMKNNNKLLCNGKRISKEARESLAISFFTALEVAKKFIIKKSDL